MRPSQAVATSIEYPPHRAVLTSCCSAQMRRPDWFAFFRGQERSCKDRIPDIGARHVRELFGEALEIKLSVEGRASIEHCSPAAVSTAIATSSARTPRALRHLRHAARTA